MFCPNCGANNTTEQSFCRSCGLKLDQIAADLLAQIPSAKSLELMRRERMLDKFGSIAFAGFGIVLLIGVISIIYLIITKMILTGQIFGGIVLIAFVVFAVLALAYVVMQEDLKEKKRKANPTLQNELSGFAPAAGSLEEKPFEPVPSVVEDTTKLLHIESKTRKLE